MAAPPLIPNPSAGPSFWKGLRQVKRGIGHVYDWARTPTGQGWLKWLIFPLILVTGVLPLGGLIGYNIHAELPVSFVQNVSFSGCQKSPDPSVSFNAPSYWLCLGEQSGGKITNFWDRDEFPKTDSSDIATVINNHPNVAFSIIASGSRDTAHSQYPNILCLYSSTVPIAEPLPLPSYCGTYPEISNNQVQVPSGNTHRIKLGYQAEIRPKKRLA